jgi:hypothetical protein
LSDGDSEVPKVVKKKQKGAEPLNPHSKRLLFKQDQEQNLAQLKLTRLLYKQQLIMRIQAKQGRISIRSM